MGETKIGQETEKASTNIENQDASKILKNKEVGLPSKDFGNTGGYGCESIGFQGGRGMHLKERWGAIRQSGRGGRLTNQANHQKIGSPLREKRAPL